MGRQIAILGKLTPDEAPRAQSADHTSPYAELIQRLFLGPSVVAVLGSGPGHNVTHICEAIAGELSRSGHRVVLVPVAALLQTDLNTLTAETASLPQLGRTVWTWPSPVRPQNELFKSRPAIPGRSWLQSLRQEFDSVLLDCPALDVAPGAVALAAMADAAVLAVDSLRSRKQQIVMDQRILQLGGVKLQGSILIGGE